MITLPVIEQLDPSIKHRLIAPADVIPNKDPKSPNRNPSRQWCEGGSVICIQSKYQLEGRLPLGLACQAGESEGRPLFRLALNPNSLSLRQIP
jgi:hypothetical protein